MLGMIRDNNGYNTKMEKSPPALEHPRVSRFDADV